MNNIKMFPILMDYRISDRIADMRSASSPYLAVCIPWDMLQPHEKQAQANHHQTLIRLAERGGLGADEALAVLEDRRYRPMNFVEANEQLYKLMTVWIDSQTDGC